MHRRTLLQTLMAVLLPWKQRDVFPNEQRWPKWKSAHKTKTLSKEDLREMVRKDGKEMVWLKPVPSKKYGDNYWLCEDTKK